MEADFSETFLKGWKMTMLLADKEQRWKYREELVSILINHMNERIANEREKGDEADQEFIREAEKIVKKTNRMFNDAKSAEELDDKLHIIVDKMIEDNPSNYMLVSRNPFKFAQ